MGAFAFGEAALAIAGGRALVIHATGTDFAEKARRTLDAEIVALALGGDEIVVLQAGGTASILDLGTGATKRELDVGAGASALAAAPGALAAAGPAGVVMEKGADLTPMDLRGATGLALHDGRLAIGTQEGAVRLVDVAAARALGAARVGGAVRAIAWCPRGYWIAATAHALVRVTRDGSEAFQLVDGKELELGPLACDAAGAFVAVRIGERKVGVFDLLEGRLRANASYASAVVGVGFGPDGALGVGLAPEGGPADFDVLDLATGKGRGDKAIEARAKLEDIADIRARVAAKEAPSPELMRRPAPGGAPVPTRAAIFAIVGFALLAFALLYLIRA